MDLTRIASLPARLPGFVLPVLFTCLFVFPNAAAQTAVPLPSIDFSFAGYGGGGVHLPPVPAVLSVSPSGGDDTRLLQAAINEVARMPVQPNGFRGALQLREGTFRVSGTLRISADGIVLRGMGEKETVLLATGDSRRAVIEAGNPEAPAAGPAVGLKTVTVPAGSRILAAESMEDFRTGDRIVITRPSSREWIASETVKMQRHWPEGSRNLVWYRTIEAVDRENGTFTIDAPVTASLERRYGGGTVARLAAGRPARQIGIERFLIQSEFDRRNPKDEEHAWFGLVLDNIEDAWVGEVTSRHLVCSAVRIGPSGRRITIKNCRNLDPVSELGGFRRLAFWVEGQQVMVEGCTAQGGINDFATGLMAGGPNVFRNCTAIRPEGPSGSLESWAPGVLYEAVDIQGGGLRLAPDTVRTQAGGWTAANSVIWNCTADKIEALGPASAPVVVVRSEESLFEKQLRERTGRLLPAETAYRRGDLIPPGIRSFTVQDIPAETTPQKSANRPFRIMNGRFVTGNETLWGGAVNDAWWLGFAAPAQAPDGGVSITRFMPGRTGTGLTEDLPALARRVKAQGTPFYQSGPYGLWYDRRRDEHSLGERADGMVWGPFLEAPWARSGQGKAWDGLSKYDLTRYNPWYFSRLRQFSALADEHGLVLYHHAYNNHNLVEVGPHWVDFSWRPANNINQTGLPEPPPFDDRNRIHVANEFYDTGSPALRQLHRSYILHLLDSIGKCNNLVLSAGFQFFGPLSFQRFFMETVAEWEKANGHPVRIVLGTSKDITDSILADPERARQVAVIDTRYWQYRPDGTLWAPPGGRNRAFREFVTDQFGRSVDFPDATTPQQAYRQVREYRDKYPDKAVVAWHNETGPIPALMAGAAQVLLLNPAAGHRQGRIVDAHPLDTFVRRHLASSLHQMLPRDGMLQRSETTWMLADKAAGTVLVYSVEGAGIQLLKRLSRKRYKAAWFDPRTGKESAAELPRRLKKGTVIRKPDGQGWLLLLKR